MVTTAVEPAPAGLQAPSSETAPDLSQRDLKASAAASEAPAAGHEAPQTVYRYRGNHGREVFTNIAESVPVISVESTKMELDHVPLNSELGTEINRRLVQAHARLTSTPFCQQVRADASALPSSGGTGLQVIWEEYTPIVVCGAVLLLMFLITPAMNRRVDPTEWRRVMMFAIPALAVAAGVAQSMMHVGKTVIGLRQAAQICDPQALGSLPAGASPLSARLDLVTTLQKEMARVDSMHHETVQPFRQSNR